MTHEIVQLAEQRSQVVGMLNGLLRKKLEDIVLDSMSHPEHIPEEFMEHFKLAQEHGFSDIVEGFNEIFREIGEIQTGRVLERKKQLRINQEEKALQSYFIANNGEQLNSIEQGLKYVAHEKPTRAGRLDILTSDKEGKEVKIELKARDYDSREVFFQVMKYFNDDKTGNARLIFVAPKVKADLLFGLAEHERSGRMEFFEVEKSNGGYVVKRKTSDEIPEPTPIKWMKRPRQLSNGLVKVISGMPRQAGMSIKDSGNEVLKDEIPQGSFDDTVLAEQPLYYQALLVFNPELNDKERYLQPIEVSDSQLKSLYSLVETEDSRKVLEDYANTMRLLREEKNDVRIGTECLLGDQTDYLNNVFLIFSKLSKIYREDSSKITDEDLKRDFLNLRKVLTLAYTKANKIAISNRKMIIKAIRKGKLPSRIGFGPHNPHVNTNPLMPCKMVNAYFSLKLDRTFELMEVDKNLALAYFICGDAYSVKTRKEGYEHPNSYDGQLFFMFDAIHSDNEVYKSILSNIKVRQESLQESGIERKVQADVEMPIVSAVEPKNEATVLGYSIESVVPMKVYSNSHLTNDSKLRVKYFVDEVLNNEQYSEQVRQELAHKAKKSRWFTKGWTELQVRNYFDDLTLKAVKASRKQD